MRGLGERLTRLRDAGAGIVQTAPSIPGAAAAVSRRRPVNGGGGIVRGVCGQPDGLGRGDGLVQRQRARLAAPQVAAQRA